jgi:hypothetical protein
MFAETPDFFGGKHELTDCPVKHEVRREILERVDSWSDRM